MIRLYCNPNFKDEKAYAWQVLLDTVLGIPYEIIWTVEQAGYRLALPNGASLLVEDHFWGRLNGRPYLSQENIPDQVINGRNPIDQSPLTIIYGRDFFSIDDKEGVCGLDLAASAFFMLTRWEEYVRPERDQHGRFPCRAALAMRQGFLHRPVVQEWAALLYQLMEGLGWSAPRRIRTWQLHLSCDVDHPRLWWRPSDRLRTLAGALFSRKSPAEFLHWLFRDHAKDPYDVFDVWFQLFRERHITAQFNFLGDRPTDSDCWYALDHPFVLDLIRRILDNGHQIGFHPSYESLDQPATFTAELQSLRQITGTGVDSGRQHYLRFEAPVTWRNWAAAGMRQDSTLGYAEQVGFRCGICLPYPVFDFLDRRILPLEELPLLAMDVTLAQYQQCTPELGFATLEALKQQVIQHQGVFTLLWHNSSWDTHFWKPWQPVFKKIISA